MRRRWNTDGHRVGHASRVSELAVDPVLESGEVSAREEKSARMKVLQEVSPQTAHDHLCHVRAVYNMPCTMQESDQSRISIGSA